MFMLISEKSKLSAKVFNQMFFSDEVIFSYTQKFFKIKLSKNSLLLKILKSFIYIFD